MNTISREELKKKMDRQEVFALFEILPLTSYQRAHLPGARPLPLEQFDNTVSLWRGPKTQDIVVYCYDETCTNSHQAAQKLLDLGYQNVKVYVGGKQDWIAAHLPIVKE